MNKKGKHSKILSGIKEVILLFHYAVVFVFEIITWDSFGGPTKKGGKKDIIAMYILIVIFSLVIYGIFQKI